METPTERTDDTPTQNEAGQEASTGEGEEQGAETQQGAKAGEGAQQRVETQREPGEAGKEKEPAEAERLAVIDQNPDLEDPRLYSPLQEPDRPSRESRRPEETHPQPAEQPRGKEAAPAQPAGTQSPEAEGKKGDSGG